jgi:hypothetical protein
LAANAARAVPLAATVEKLCGPTVMLTPTPFACAAFTTVATFALVTPLVFSYPSLFTLMAK